MFPVTASTKLGAVDVESMPGHFLSIHLHHKLNDKSTNNHKFSTQTSGVAAVAVAVGGCVDAAMAAAGAGAAAAAATAVATGYPYPYPYP